MIFERYEPWGGATVEEKSALITLSYAPLAAFIYVGIMVVFLGLFMLIKKGGGFYSIIFFYVIKIVVLFIIILLLFCFVKTFLLIDSSYINGKLVNSTIDRAREMSYHISRIVDDIPHGGTNTLEIYNKKIFKEDINKYEVFDSWGVPFYVEKDYEGCVKITSNCNNKSTVIIIMYPCLK